MFRERMASIRLDGLRMRRRIQAAKQGDQQAIAFLCTYFEPDLRRYVERHTSARVSRWVEPADIVQLVLASVFCPALRLPEGACGSHLLHHLHQMARWRICDAARHYGRDLGESVVLSTRGSEPTEPAYVAPTCVTSSVEWTSSISRRVSELPEHHREVVRLRLAGLGYAQIGRILELDPETVRSRYRRAIQILRRGLRDIRREAS